MLYKYAMEGFQHSKLWVQTIITSTLPRQATHEVLLTSKTDKWLAPVSYKTQPWNFTRHLKMVLGAD